MKGEGGHYPRSTSCLFVREFEREERLSEYPATQPEYSSTAGRLIKSIIEKRTARPKQSPFIDRLLELLKENESKRVHIVAGRRYCFNNLQWDGYHGGDDTVRRYIGQRVRLVDHLPKVFIPLECDPGEAFLSTEAMRRWNWGMPVEVKIAQFRLYHSRKPFCIAYPQMSLEMVLDAHGRAFEFSGVSAAGGYRAVRNARFQSCDCPVFTSTLFFPKRSVRLL